MDEGDKKLYQLFRVCDIDGSGYIDQSELARVCPDLSTNELSDVFKELDADGDGRISVEEFDRGFKEISNNLLSISRDHFRRKSLANLVEEEEAEGAMPFVDDEGSLEKALKSLSCQEEVYELYQSLHANASEEVVKKFEQIILNVVKDVHQYKLEGEKMEKIFSREKERYDRLSKHLEEEMENQMKKTEERIRKEERKKAAAEKAEMKTRLENEIAELQESQKQLQQEDIYKKDKNFESQIALLRDREEELKSMNRQLKSEITDSQTTMAILRSEMATRRQDFEDKCRELQMEKVAIVEFIKEQDNLTRQLHLLHDANKKLQDTNDDLREALESTRQAAHKRSYSTGSSLAFETKRQITDATFCEDQMPPPSLRMPASLAEEVVMAEAMAGRMVTFPNRPRKESYEEDRYTEDRDSGNSTIRDNNDIDTESECTSPGSELRRGRRHKRFRNNYDHYNEDPESHDEMDAETDSQMETDLLSLVSARRTESASSRGSQKSLRSLGQDDSSSIVTSYSNRSLRKSISYAEENAVTKTSKDPERMYKVVLAGDAAVGKSSFIMRLCKGKFVNNLSSTLGVDFQTKIVEVDGHIIALQLWDTAGQERFRSIAKSYFRRADGVLLLYDCTYERSFLNVRDWIQAIEDGAQKHLPIMLCANKSDMRAEIEAVGRRTVRFEDGQRLARSFEGLFIETSAKEGSNINEAVIELTRLLRTNEDLEVKSVGMQLHNIKISDRKKSGNCCRR